jgi:hypothetical protein
VLADGLASSENSFTVYPGPSNPAGYVELPRKSNASDTDRRMKGYQVELVRRMNNSENLMTALAQSSVVTSGPATPQNSSMPRGVLTVIIAAVVVIVLLAMAGSIWFCWFRKRRQRARVKSRSPPLGRKGRILDYFRHRSAATSNSTVCEAKADVEDCGTFERLDQRESKDGRSGLVRGSTLPLPPPTRPGPVQDTAELPLFITPRSSRQVSSTPRPLTLPAELDTSPRSPRPGPVDEAEAGEDKVQSSVLAGRSERLSLQQIFQVRKLAELEGNAKSPPYSSEHSAYAGDSEENQVSVGQKSPARGPKRLSLQHVFHLKRIAELEGSSISSAQPPDANTSNDQGSKNWSPRRSHRISFHRLLSSRRLAELEPCTDILPEYSNTDKGRKSHELPPPLPPKDVDINTSLSTPQPVKRAMTPIELDASEPVQLSRRPLQGLSSNRSPNQIIAALAGSSSSSSPAVCKDQAVMGCSDHVADDASEDFLIMFARSSVNSTAASSRPPTPEALEFLDLASTESEGGAGEDPGFALDDAFTSLSNFGTPHNATPMKDGRIDPFSNAEIDFALLDTSRTFSIPPKTQHDEESGEEDEAEEELPVIHEMDSFEVAMKRRSRTQNSHAVSMRSEALRRRPDFVTFKKQMSEAERRAKMIAKHRRSRRRLMPNSF